ncbi:MAG TPA: TolC family protein [Firmicutes bacterium]|nr:TolC family protein [Bacillota bacterium]
MKKTITVLLSTFILLLFFPAPTSAVTESSSIRPLDLSKAIELALDLSPERELARIQVEKAKLTLRDAKSAKDKADEAEDLGYSMNTYTSDLNVELLVPKAEYGLAEAERYLDLVDDKIRYQVTRAYYNALKTKNNLDVARLAQTRGAELLKNACASFNSGIISKADYLATEAAVEPLNTAVRVAEDKYTLSLMQLSKEIGLEVDTAIELTTELPAPISETIDLQVDEAKALSNSLTLQKARDAFDIQTRAYDFTRRYYPPNVRLYRQVEYDYLKAKISLADAEEAMRIAVRRLYNQVRAAEQAISSAEKALVAAREAARLKELNLRAGVATHADVLEAYQQLSVAEANQAAALFDYHTAKLMYNNLRTGLDPQILGQAD